MKALTEEQRALAERHISIAIRAAANAARKQAAHEHQILSAAQWGVMVAAENYERLSVKMPFEDWAAVQANMAIRAYFRSKFGRRMKHEVGVGSERFDFDELFVDPKSSHDFQTVDVNDLLSRIARPQYALMARRVVFDQTSRRDAEEEARVPHATAAGVWGKLTADLVELGQL